MGPKTDAETAKDRESFSKRLEVTAALIFEQDKILITSRGQKDLWEFPGGKVEHGETREECIIREIKEELGLGIQVEKFFTSVDYDSGQTPLTLYSFICNIVSGRPESLSGQQISWVKPVDLVNCNLLPADRLMIESLVEYTSGKAKK